MFDVNLEAIKSAYKLSEDQEMTLAELLKARIPEIDGLSCTALGKLGLKAIDFDSTPRVREECGPVLSKVVNGTKYAYKALFVDNEVRFNCCAVKKDIGASDPDHTYATQYQDPLFNRFQFVGTLKGTMTMSFADRGNVVRVIKRPDDEDYIVQIFTSGANFEHVQNEPFPDDAFKISVGDDDGTSRTLKDVDTKETIATLANPIGKKDNAIRLMWLVGTKVNGEYIDRNKAQVTTESEQRGRR